MADYDGAKLGEGWGRLPGMRQLRSSCWLVLSVTVACVSCNGSDAEVVGKPEQDAGFDAQVPFDAASDGAALDAGADAPMDAATDAPIAAVRIGVEPEPRESDEEPDTALQIAQLESFSAGSRAVSVDVRWDELVNDQLELRADRLAALATRIQVVRNAGAKLSLCLALVERAVDARPANGLAWNASSMQSAARRVVDAVLELTGDELSFFSLGLESDRYFRALPQFLRGSFVDAMQGVLEYARAHPALPPMAKVGVGVTADGWSGASSSFASWIQNSDALIVSYIPLDENLMAEPPSVVVADLDAMYDNLVEIRGGAPIVPIVIHRVGYPSTADVSASEEQQRTFYSALFQALQGRRGRFPFVGVYGLNDPDPQRCVDFRLTLGGDALSHPERAEAAYCSLGLHSRRGVAKPAWSEVLAGMATFASP